MLRIINVFSLLFVFVVNSFELAQECGKTLNNHVDWRVINGQDAEQGEFPWHVLITEKSHFNDEYGNSCGAALLNDKWVLTAGHCLVLAVEGKKLEPGDLIVRLGVHNMSLKEDSELDVAVDMLIIHEKLNLSISMDNDIALMRMKDPVDFKVHKNLFPVCLPKNTTKVTNKCVATGFGVTVEHGKNLGHPSNGILKKVNDPVIDDEKCSKFYGHEYNGDLQLCASGNTATVPHATCSGDSGGPLTCLADDQRWYQLGITSYGGDCADVKSLDVFTRVTAYIDWIENAIKNNSN